MYLIGYAESLLTSLIDTMVQDGCTQLRVFSNGLQAPPPYSHQYEKCSKEEVIAAHVSRFRDYD